MAAADGAGACRPVADRTVDPAELIPDHGAAARRYLGELQANLIRADMLVRGGHQRGADLFFACMYELAADLCAVAGLIGFPRSAEIASSLCFLLDRMRNPSRALMRALSEHIALIERDFETNPAGIDASAEEELAVELAGIRAEAGVIETKPGHPEPALRKKTGELLSRFLRREFERS